MDLNTSNAQPSIKSAIKKAVLLSVLTVLVSIVYFNIVPPKRGSALFNEWFGGLTGFFLSPITFFISVFLYYVLYRMQINPKVRLVIVAIIIIALILGIPPLVNYFSRSSVGYLFTN